MDSAERPYDGLCTSDRTRGFQCCRSWVYLGSMYDPLRAEYRMRCPERSPDGDRRYGVTLSQFVSVTRLAGAQHPAIYCVRHECAACGGSHDALLTHDELDHAPVVGPPSGEPFWDPLTGPHRRGCGRRAARSSREPRAPRGLALAVLVRRGGLPQAALPVRDPLCRAPRSAGRHRGRVLGLRARLAQRRDALASRRAVLPRPGGGGQRPPAAGSRRQPLRRGARRRADARATPLAA